jgi:hypothetical protein
VGAAAAAPDGVSVAIDGAVRLGLLVAGATPAEAGLRGRAADADAVLDAAGLARDAVLRADVDAPAAADVAADTVAADRLDSLAV